ncbi:MAG TPA: hypothetical protein VFU54_17285 [Actinomycetota bacterium]|nr:hypothetical protein [Actinomycetota bacterium]
MGSNDPELGPRRNARQPADPSGAFIYRKGRYTPLDAVDGLTTAHTGINRGQLVGSFSPDGATLRGFVRDERGNYTRFDAAPGVITLALDINDRGTVVGTYGVTEFRGFVRKPNGSVTTIDVPGASSTFVVGINDRGAVVGSYVDADGREHGFLLERGKMTVIDHPDSPRRPGRLQHRGLRHQRPGPDRRLLRRCQRDLPRLPLRQGAVHQDRPPRRR